ncbi:CAP domain-containing protein [Histidinibacterium aquaticum]|uniref:CAP domain-containing protein n=1 Tax=Histidinibacterium aquaticum TaxID=2613962 RepID=A0A5J5GM50_9RHOB|nr:CAP domain-containing protein [Histidinibacterium aquaticum]KAA9009371.1 CAP domain-containing protein [Histidinibacterium aquaticum]
MTLYKLTALLALPLVAACGGGSGSGGGSTITPPSDIAQVAGDQIDLPDRITSVERTEFGMVLNDARTGGLREVRADQRLNTAAQDYTGEIERSGRRIIDGDNLHVGTDGRTVGDRVTAAGYDFDWVGENIAQGYTNSEDVVDAWLASKQGHREVVLSPRAEDFGIGRTETTWVLIMGAEN